QGGPLGSSQEPAVHCETNRTGQGALVNSIAQGGVMSPVEPPGVGSEHGGRLWADAPRRDRPGDDRAGRRVSRRLEDGLLRTRRPLARGGASRTPLGAREGA